MYVYVICIIEGVLCYIYTYIQTHFKWAVNTDYIIKTEMGQQLVTILPRQHVRIFYKDTFIM